jgi:hypothetical protein
MEFPIWKTITLGVHKTPEDYHRAIQNSVCRFNDGGDARHILNKTEVSQAEVELDLVIMTVDELGLGFKDGVRQDVIYARAIEMGLQLCPAEVGPALRLLYKDQPRGERLRIVMEPLIDWDGLLGSFAVEHDDAIGTRWLNRYVAEPGFILDADCKLVLVRPRE